jgi:hypothetical protein
MKLTPTHSVKIQCLKHKIVPKIKVLANKIKILINNFKLKINNFIKIEIIIFSNKVHYIFNLKDKIIIIINLSNNHLNNRHRTNR